MGDFTGSGLECIRGERVVFRGVSFALGAGTMMELRGANGSGKSSLLRMMAGLLPPSAGSIAWNGVPIAREPDAHRARVAYVGHQDGVKGMLTVAENLLFWAALRGTTEHLAGAIAHFNLGTLIDMPARHLSAGQRRRVALARLLACPAPLWLLDEPATALDAEAQATLERAVANHVAQGGMVAMATHDESRRAALRLDLDRVPA